MIGIIRYPGSNCDYDTLRYFKNSFFIWHTETELPKNLELLVIPGGFAFGDRVYNKATASYTISPGTKAIESPVSTIIKEAAAQKIPILGICNGFQILTQMGLLPGRLELNNDQLFTCKKVPLTIYSNVVPKDVIELYIANSYGKYTITEEDNLDLEKDVFLRYSDYLPELDSYDNIAGISNKDKTIFGMMPHPERNNSDYDTLYKIVTQHNYLNLNLNLDKELKLKIPLNQTVFEDAINTLMNSEHISYKSTRKYLKTMHTQENWVVQGPGENAGIVDIGGGYCIAIRIESHNHPTFINAFEGAATGVGGIMRDIFTMGARPIGILDFLRFGTDDNSNKLLREAIHGISYYGNCVGVPNLGGDLYRDSHYDKNPIVNVGCIGLVKKENIIYGAAQYNDSVLIYVGSKTGNEGINGAAMASNSFKNDTNIKDMEKNVQKSDPFLEKLLLEACCEIAELKLAEGMQDMGAGGLLCASYEVIMRGREKTNTNMGCTIDLSKVPTKYEMESCNVLISESQERMLIVCKKDNREHILSIFQKWDLEYAEIGVVTNHGKYDIYNDNQLLYTRELTNLKDATQDWKLATIKERDIEKIKNKYLWRQYDSTVGNRTLKGPDMDGSYSILNIHEINKKIILTWDKDCYVCYNKIIQMSGTPLCLVNCLNYGHPEETLGNLVDTINKINIFCKFRNIPVVGGNVSLYNSTETTNIPSTPVILMLGILG